MRIILFALMVIAAPASLATTLVVMYRPDVGAVIAIDSALASAVFGEIQRGVPTIRGSVPGCKIHPCGRYFVAYAGFGGVTGLEFANICGD
jgi:hypothetical protein